MKREREREGGKGIVFFAFLHLTLTFCEEKEYSQDNSLSCPIFCQENFQALPRKK